MSLGLVVLEEKLFTRTRTPTPKSDDIMSAGGIFKLKLFFCVANLVYIVLDQQHQYHGTVAILMEFNNLHLNCQ